MGGWLIKRLILLKTSKGLKMRIPGLGGEFLKKVGGSTINLPWWRIFTSFTDWRFMSDGMGGPYND